MKAIAELINTRTGGERMGQLDIGRRLLCHHEFADLVADHGFKCAGTHEGFTVVQQALQKPG
ncbi:uncharacterized protein METZ01_LOCUS364766, partial [marine metagenome]